MVDDFSVTDQLKRLALRISELDARVVRLEAECSVAYLLPFLSSCGFSALCWLEWRL